MTTLYELSEHYANAMLALQESDFDDETINNTLEGIEGEVNDKFEAVAMYQQNLVNAAEAKMQRSKELSDQAKAMEAKAQKMYDYIDTNMRKLGKDKLSCKYFDIGYRKLPPSVEVVDQSKVSSQFIKVKITESVDKVAAKKAMQNGENIEGLELIKDKVKLEIK